MMSFISPRLRKPVGIAAAGAVFAARPAARIGGRRDDGGMRPDPDDKPVLPEQSEEEAGCR
jgi:hypothetical protein